MNTNTTTPAPAYSNQPATGDARFCLGLALDVAEVLHRHGYPPVRTGADLLRLQRALFTLIYQEKTP